MKKLKATCENILSTPVKFEPAEEKVVDGIIVPPETQRLLDKKNPLIELEVLAVGHLVVKVKPGDHILYNKFHGDPLPWGDTGLIHLTEHQVFAVIDNIPEPVVVPVQAPVEKSPLTIADIKARLGMVVAPVDDQSAVPVEAAPGA